MKDGDAEICDQCGLEIHRNWKNVVRKDDKVFCDRECADERKAYVEVYHANNPDYRNAFPFNPRNYTHVANVETNDLDEAWEATQHLDAPWFRNDNVTARVESRSTAVGDILALDGILYAVAMVGFVEFDGKESLNCLTAKG